MKGRPPTATLVLVHGTLEVEPPWPERLLARKGLKMKRDVLMLAGAMLAGLVGGAVSTLLFTRGVSGYAQQERVIRAERFELVDENGKLRAVLGELVDQNQSPRVGEQEARTSGLVLYDKDGYVIWQAP